MFYLSRLLTKITKYSKLEEQQITTNERENMSTLTLRASAKKAPAKRLTKVTKKSKALGPVIPYLETWNTRYGVSERIVYRRNGKFIDSISLSALRHGTKVN